MDDLVINARMWKLLRMFHMNVQAPVDFTMFMITVTSDKAQNIEFRELEKAQILTYN